MAKKNSVNNATGDLTIDPGASGDSFVQFDINGTGEFRIGVDDDASDAFKVSQGSALGTNDTFVMTAAGERTMPLQPAFLTHRDADLTDVTGDGTTYTIVWDSEQFDQNGDFDGTSTFIAPVTGKYFFSVGIFTAQLAAAHTVSQLYIVATGDTYRFDQCDPGAIASSGTLTFLGSAIIPMTAADTCVAQLRIAGGTKVVDITGNTAAGNASNWFGCYLMV
jgi:hypothetical protein